MRRLLTLGLLTFAPILVLAQPAYSNLYTLPISEPETNALTIQKTVHEVQLTFTATNRKGHFVEDLAPEELKLLDHRLPPARVLYFRRHQELPLHLVILIDASSSVAPRFRAEQRSARDFVDSVLRNPEDRAAVIMFTHRSKIEEDFTGDVNRLAQAIQRLRSQTGMTAIFDAVRLACTRLRAIDHGEPRRRAIVLITDGEENASRASVRDAIEAAQAADVALFAVPVGADWSPLSADKTSVLPALVGQIGGKLFPATLHGKMSQAFKKIEEQLRSQYVIGYTPDSWQSDGRFRRIQLSTERRGVRLHCRPGYYAGEELPPVAP